MFNAMPSKNSAAPLSVISPTGPTASPRASCLTLKPPRPQGVERNIVVTTWDWLDDKHYLHDLIASDRRFPTVNAYGPVYGSTELSVDVIPILDPKTHTDQELPGSRARSGYARRATADKPMQPSPYWGNEQVWKSKANNHNGMFDRNGRVWFAAAVRGPE